ncbi:MAG: YtxH domain-containing protein [Candidatus Kapaibacterium sp.]
MSERESSNGYLNGFLTGALIGGAIGAITALVFAPKPGRELRRDIAERSVELYDKAQELIGRAGMEPGYEVVPVVNDGRARAERIVQTARDHAESLMADAEQVLRDARSKATSVRDHVAEGFDRVRDAAAAGAEAFGQEWNSKNQHEG